MGIANWELWSLPVYAPLILIFIPVYLRNRIGTVPELLSRRFGPACADIYSWVMLLAYVFIFLVPVLYGGSLAMSDLTGLNFYLVLWLMVVLVGIYTVKGGLASVMWTDAAQCLMLLGGGLVHVLAGYVGLVGAALLFGAGVLAGVGAAGDDQAGRHGARIGALAAAAVSEDDRAVLRVQTPELQRRGRFPRHHRQRLRARLVEDGADGGALEDGFRLARSQHEVRRRDGRPVRIGDAGSLDALDLGGLGIGPLAQSVEVAGVVDRRHERRCEGQTGRRVCHRRGHHGTDGRPARMLMGRTASAGADPGSA